MQKNSIPWLYRFILRLVLYGIGLGIILFLSWLVLVPSITYLHFGGDVEWQRSSPESMFKYWLTPLNGGLVLATGITAYEWYENASGHPVKKALYALLFCAVVGVFDFAVLIPWGREMVPHLVQWWNR